MSRLIDADAVEKVLNDFHINRPLDSDRWIIAKIKESIMNLPTIDTDISEYSDRLWKIAYERGRAEAVKRGKWKWLSCTYDRVPKEKEYECSECHHKTIVHGDEQPWEKYCPNCGARMDKDE